MDTSLREGPAFAPGGGKKPEVELPAVIPFPVRRDPAPSPWPKSAQWTTAVLLALVVILLGFHALEGMGFSSHSSELVEPEGPLYRLDLNRAREVELVQIPGVGPKLAGKIVSFRQSHGPFGSISDLARVPGIGPKTLEKIRPWVCVDAETLRDARPMAPGISGKKVRAPVKGHGKSKKEALLAGIRININTASAADLQRLPGIGPRLSERIIDERENGLFQSVDDLRRVKGIGPKIMARLRPYLTVTE